MHTYMPLHLIKVACMNVGTRAIYRDIDSLEKPYVEDPSLRQITTNTSFL